MNKSLKSDFFIIFYRNDIHMKKNNNKKNNC